MARDEYKEMEVVARVLAVKLQVISARDPDTIENAFWPMTKERAQALVVTPHPRYLEHGDRILRQAVNSPAGHLFPKRIGREWRTYVLRHKQCR